MLVVLAYCPKDLAQTERLAKWMVELGGCKKHKLILIEDTRIQNGVVRRLCEEAFESVQVVSHADHYDKWPHAPNHIFQTAARQINEPWLWIEPDCCPLTPDWIDQLEAEYRAKGKPFLGDFVEGVGGSPDHMSGVGIYPGTLARHAGNALLALDDPWDLVAAGQIVPQCHFTEKISHTWRRHSFLKQAEVDALPKEAVLYHASKDGSLIRLLRDRKNLAAAGNCARGELATGLSDSPHETPAAVQLWSKPWENREQSIARITELARELKTFYTHPRYISAVRKVLKKQGVIK